MQEAISSSSVKSAQIKCLIVDDSAFARFHMRRLIDSFENVQASEASNGSEAVSEYRRVRPDFVLMDIVMPGMEGVEAVRRICAVDPAAKVIMISSLSHKEKVKEAFEAGAKYFIPKPVTTVVLKEAIEAVMRAMWGSKPGAIL